MESIIAPPRFNAAAWRYLAPPGPPWPHPSPGESDQTARFPQIGAAIGTAKVWCGRSPESRGAHHETKTKSVAAEGVHMLGPSTSPE